MARARLNAPEKPQGRVNCPAVCLAACPHPSAGDSLLPTAPVSGDEQGKVQLGTLRGSSSVSQVLEAVPAPSICQLGHTASRRQFRPNLHVQHGAECVITELHKQPSARLFPNMIFSASRNTSRHFSSTQLPVGSGQGKQWGWGEAGQVLPTSLTWMCPGRRGHLLPGEEG